METLDVAKRTYAAATEFKGLNDCNNALKHHTK